MKTVTTHAHYYHIETITMAVHTQRHINEPGGPSPLARAAVPPVVPSHALFTTGSVDTGTGEVLFNSRVTSQPLTPSTGHWITSTKSVFEDEQRAYLAGNSSRWWREQRCPRSPAPSPWWRRQRWECAPGSCWRARERCRTRQRRRRPEHANTQPRRARSLR